MNEEDIYNLFVKHYKPILEIDNINLNKYIDYKLYNKDKNTTNMEDERKSLKTFFKLKFDSDLDDFYLDIINHVNLEIQRVLNEQNNSYKIDICIENEYAKDFLLRIEERISLMTDSYNSMHIEEYISRKYNLPLIQTKDKLVFDFYKRLIKANHGILCELIKLDTVQIKGRPKLINALKVIRKQTHNQKMKEYMKTKYNEVVIINNNLLTEEEYKQIEESNLSDKIKNKIKMFTKSFIKK